MNCVETLSQVGSIVKARKELGRELGRPIVDDFELGCFAMFAALRSGLLIDTEAVKETMWLEDIMARQNCKADEYRHCTKIEAPGWEGRTYSREYTNLLLQISKRYLCNYPEPEAGMRMGEVLNRLQSWFIADEIAERVISNEIDPRSLSQVEMKIVEPIIQSQGEEAIFAHKKVVDMGWVGAIAATLFDGKLEGKEECLRYLLNLTLLLQLSEDFTNERRDRRINKQSFYTYNQFDSVWEKIGFFVSKTKYLLNESFENDLSKMVIATGLGIKTLASIIKSTFNGDRWRSEKKFNKVDLFELGRYQME